MQPPFLFHSTVSVSVDHGYAYMIGACLGISAALAGSANNIIVAGPLKRVPVGVVM